MIAKLYYYCCELESGKIGYRYYKNSGFTPDRPKDSVDVSEAGKILAVDIPLEFTQAEAEDALGLLGDKAMMVLDVYRDDTGSLTVPDDGLLDKEMGEDCLTTP